MKQSSDLTKPLTEARGYREFLSAFLSYQKKSNPRFSQSAFCRRAGFASRSYPGDVIRGTKDVTLKSLPKLIHAMSLSGDLAHYFTALVELAHPALSVTKTDKQKIMKRIETLRTRIKRKLPQDKSDSVTPAIFSDQRFGKIFACLGAPHEGAELKTISRKARLPLEECRAVLDELIKIGVARLDSNGKFIPLQTHLIVSDQKGKPDFQTLFMNMLKQAEKKSQSEFNSPSHLFLHSTVSISSQKLPALKQELKEILIRFVDESEEADGSAICHLTCAFFS